MAIGAILALAAAVGSAQPCPAALPEGTRCHAGQDARGAYYWSAIPARWNGALVVHAHGGPSLATPSASDSKADLVRFAVVVQEGYAWTGSSYRHAGYGVRDAAEDTDSARALFWDSFGKPRRTLLHGQSWGGNVAARTAELFPAHYDGVILTNGVMGGGSVSYDFRADLRALYQYYCNNLPAPGEARYPLWQGLGPGNTDVEQRVNACTGVNLPPAQRTPAQSRALRNIAAVIRIPEQSLGSHMAWSTGMFRDLTMRFLQGRSPFSNTGVVYRGSDDDVALNRDIERFGADPAALAMLSADSDLSGRLTMPTLSIHGIGDPTAFVELEAEFAARVAAAGASEHLLQIFTDEHEHRKLATPQYAAIFAAMMDWIEHGKRPDVHAVMRACEVANPRYGEGCRINPGYVPAPLKSRVYERVKPGRGQGGDFLGIPYAAAPTGPLRWRAPRPGPPWNGVSTLPARCPQSLAGLKAGTESEDCLYLNVHAPASDGALRPVLVYVHGGGAVNGSANDHDGRALARQGDMLVVSINYRLGALGFMHSPLTAPEAGNYGVQDVIAALDWVRRNIARFGGDPQRVTLGGESAGATVLCPLLAMPQVKGLFRAAIISSDDCLHDVDPVAVASERAAQLAGSVDCADAACLRRLPAERLVRAGGRAGPAMQAPYHAMARGAWNRIPLMIGANSEEGRSAGPGFLHYTDAQYRAWLTGLVGDSTARAIERRYRHHPGPAVEKITAIITDSGMRGLGGCTSLQLARNAARHAPVFYYQFEDKTAPPGEHGGYRLGAAHAVELAYLWPGAAFARQGAAMTPAQHGLSAAMIARWAAFVHHATPNAAGLSAWPPLTAGAYMAFGTPASGTRPLAAFEREHHCRFWRRLPVILERGEPS